jgi:hypothetical protein
MPNWETTNRDASALTTPQSVPEVKFGRSATTDIGEHNMSEVEFYRVMDAVGTASTLRRNSETLLLSRRTISPVRTPVLQSRQAITFRLAPCF